MENLDATTVRLQWDKVSGATGYSVHVRSIRDNTAFRVDGTTAQTSYEVAWLFPGNWNFEFCISAYNGNLESAPVSCNNPPVCCGYEKRDLVSTEYPQAENNSAFSNSTSSFGGMSMGSLFTTFQQSIGLALDTESDHSLAIPGKI